MRPARWLAAIVALFVSAAVVAGCGEDEPPYHDDSGGWFTVTDATNNYREFRCYSNGGGLWCYAKETP